MYKKAEASFWTAEEVSGTAAALGDTAIPMGRLHPTTLTACVSSGGPVEGPAALGVSEGRGEVLHLSRVGVLRRQRRHRQREPGEYERPEARDDGY